MENKEIVNIKTEHIHPHPDNPRKDLGDLTELADSIRKNGVMQNLTVIPVEGQPGEYLALIGNRRRAASELAGIKELPCRIVDGLTPKEQLAIMLEENMQRNDLTVYEQAQGFQMMLDLGSTEEQIAEKTGFSRATVRHRLNIARLDQEELKKKEQDEGFQLTLKDLYELEKVGDIKTRDRILKESRDSRDLVWRAHCAALDAERKKKAGVIEGMLVAKGIEKAPEKASRELYSGKWEKVRDIDLDGDMPKRITLPKDGPRMFYIAAVRHVTIVRKAEKKKREETPEEKAVKLRERNRKEIKAKIKEMDAARREFMLGIISGKISAVENEGEIKDRIWCMLVRWGIYLNPSVARRLFTNKPDYDCTQEEKDVADGKARGLSVLRQMLAALHCSMETAGDIVDYQGKYSPGVGEKMQEGYGILESYGWSFINDEWQQLIDGTHELYEKEKP